MNAREVRAAWRALPVAAPEEVTRGGPVLVLSPHPDDESLGAGGLMAASVAAGVPVHVVVLTDGAGSHPRSRRYPRDALVALRRNETAAAAAALGLPPGAVTHFDLPDTAAPLAGPTFDQAVARLAALAETVGARSLLSTWRYDPHCDHEAAAAIARAVWDAVPHLALWSYPIWGWHLEGDVVVDEPPPAGVQVAIGPWLERKRRAVAAHASQMTCLIDDDPGGFRFTPEQLEPFFRSHEVFIEIMR